MGLDLYTYEDNSILRTIVHWIVDIAVVVSFAWFIVFGYLNQIAFRSLNTTLIIAVTCSSWAIENFISFRSKPLPFSLRCGRIRQENGRIISGARPCIPLYLAGRAETGSRHACEKTSVTLSLPKRNHYESRHPF